MIKEISEKDWKLFREKIPIWQDTYIDKLNQEYIEILSSSDNPADKFWGLEKRINTDKHKTGVRKKNGVNKKCSLRKIGFNSLVIFSPKKDLFQSSTSTFWLWGSVLFFHIPRLLQFCKKHQEVLQSFFASYEEMF